MTYVAHAPSSDLAETELPPLNSVSSDKGFRRARVELSDQVVSHTCIALLYYWRAVCDGSAMPRWADMDLMSIHPIAPNLIVKDLESVTSDDGNPHMVYRNRYWGTAITSTLGFDGSRKTLSDYEVNQCGHEAMTNTYGMVVEHIRPVRSIGYIEFLKNREYIGYESLFLPLAGPVDGQISHIIAAYDFRYDPAVEGLDLLVGL